MDSTSIAEVESFTVIGLATHVESGREAIVRLWDAFVNRTDEFDGLASGSGAYGASYNYDSDTHEFEYLVGVRADSSVAVPKGMTRLEIPSGKFATVETHDAGKQTAFDALYREWLPESAYERKPGPEFEQYATRRDTANSHVTIGVPVVPIEAPARCGAAR